ncbi:MAG: TIM barrel protein [Luteitalea sp.]|nr:TIM barrel protein [Luteitalea sp.]
MDQTTDNKTATPYDRRHFLRTAGVAVAAASPLVSRRAPAATRPTPADEKLAKIASNTYPLRWLFTRRRAARQTSDMAEQMKQTYGEITMLDFPQFTKDTFPGVRHMDLWSSLFGDVTDDAMYATRTVARGEQTRTVYEFDPATTAGKKWLDTLADRMATTGVQCHHVSNNAPRDISDLDPDKRKAGIQVAKTWLDACAQIGAKSMRVNTGGPRIAPSATATEGYPRNDDIVKYLRNAIESFREMADYGAKVGVKVTIENHWGLSADPMNVRIILDEINHPYCEASPDFANWEHEYLLYHGLEALMPYAHTTVHAKYWDRWGEVDLRRCVQILNEANYQGKIALEYEAGPWDGVEGCRYMLKEILAAL